MRGCVRALLIEDGAEEVVRGTAPCVLTPAEETVRRVFPTVLTAEEEEELEEAEEEEKAAAGLWTGVRGKLSEPASGVDVISHFGGIMDCLGGSGSRSVSLRTSELGTY